MNRFLFSLIFVGLFNSVNVFSADKPKSGGFWATGSSSGDSSDSDSEPVGEKEKTGRSYGRSSSFDESFGFEGDAGSGAGSGEMVGYLSEKPEPGSPGKNMVDMTRVAMVAMDEWGISGSRAAVDNALTAIAAYPKGTPQKRKRECVNALDNSLLSPGLARDLGARLVDGREIDSPDMEDKLVHEIASDALEESPGRSRTRSRLAEVADDDDSPSVRFRVTRYRHILEGDTSGGKHFYELGDPSYEKEVTGRVLRNRLGVEASVVNVDGRVKFSTMFPRTDEDTVMKLIGRVSSFFVEPYAECNNRRIVVDEITGVPIVVCVCKEVVRTAFPVFGLSRFNIAGHTILVDAEDLRISKSADDLRALVKGIVGSCSITKPDDSDVRYIRGDSALIDLAPVLNKSGELPVVKKGVLLEFPLAEIGKMKYPVEVRPGDIREISGIDKISFMLPDEDDD